MHSRENSIVFTPPKIGSLEIKNRLVRSATYGNAAKGGEVSDFLVDLYCTLAEGASCLINKCYRDSDKQKGVDAGEKLCYTCITKEEITC